MKKFIAIGSIILVFAVKSFAFCAGDSIPDNDTVITQIPSNGTRIFAPNIKTIKAYTSGRPLSFPMITLNDGQQIEVMFDELSAESHSFSYKLIHCNADWQPSRLMNLEYIKGFETTPITNWQPSQNTSIDYVHYTFSFPNDNVTLLKSGNYLVQVYNDSNLSKPVFETRTIIVDNIITINATVQKSTFVENMNLMQEVNIDLNLNDLNVRNPYQDIKVCVLQNGRWDNALSSLEPTFVNNNEISYPRDGSNLFEGGNEFRRFNTKTYKYITEHIRNYRFNGRNYVYTLQTDEPRRFKEYEKNGDLNGNYLVLNDLGQDDALTSEYVDVTFELKYDDPEPMGNIYIFGAITNWQANDDSKMVYDSVKHAYTKTLLLKQGMYDYQYAYVDNITKKIDCTYEENTHQETENVYYFFVYHRDFLSNSDYIVGYSYTSR